MDDLSLYVHIPFCRHRCAYCDFNTVAGHEQMIPVYVRALCREIELVARSAGQPLPAHTIFFGGGTPSLLPAADLQAIMHALAANFDLRPGSEVSLEANPGTVSPDYLEDLRRMGINRLSFGMQSAHPDDLRLLERIHSYQDVAAAVRWARQAGFDNLNLDLIFGLPYQTLERWQQNLDRALALQPEHLSLYSLIVEPGTPLHRWVGRGLLSAPDDELAADMYELASERLESAGYHQYEISNWARCGENGEVLACRHNLQYWRNRPYLGLGSGAHGYANGKRVANVKGIRPFVKRSLERDSRDFPVGPAAEEVNPIDRKTEMQETLMVGLRLTEEGVSARGFAQRFGEPLDQVFHREIRRLTGNGLLEWAGPQDDALRLTRRGRLLGNQVFMQFVG